MRYAVFVLLLLSNCALANVCEVKSGEIKLTGSDTLYTVKNSWIEECSGTLEIISNEAEICLFNQLKQWHCKAQQKRDGLIEISELTIDEEYATGFFTALKALFDPDTEMQYGGLRLKEGEPLPGFPYSEILLPAQSLDLDIARATSEPVSRFNIIDAADGREIFADADPGSTVSVPANMFTPGKEYQWAMTGDTKKFSGTFAIVETADQLEFEADLSSAVATGGQAGAADDLMRAIVAREYGYTFDYEQAWYKARQSLNTAQSGGTR